MVAFSASTAMAQPKDPRSVWGVERDYKGVEGLGVKAGVVLNRIGGNEAINPGFVAGAGAGGYAAYRIHKHARLQIEALWVQKAGSIETKEHTTIDYDLSYIEVPLLIQGVIPTSSPATVLVYGGLSRSWLLLASARSGGASADTKDVTSNNDTGVVVGVSLEWKLDFGRALADLRIDYGFQTLDDDGGSIEDDLRHRSLMLMVGYSAF